MSFTFAYGLMPIQFAHVTELDSPDHITKATDQERATATSARDQAASIIEATLWPKFKFQSAPQSLGGPYDKLLAADFRVLIQLFATHDQWDEATRRQWALEFHCEDTFYEKIGTPVINDRDVVIYRTQFAASFDRYLNTKHSDQDLDVLDHAFSAYGSMPAMSRLRDWVKLSLKHMFQRPRPYQYAYELGVVGFRHKCSMSAHSPSTPSGHAFDSALAGIQAEASIGPGAWYPHVTKLPLWAGSMPHGKS